MFRFLMIASVAMAVVSSRANGEGIEFNHVFVNVTPQTFEAIRASSYINEEFASGEIRTVVADGGKAGWSGFYLYGERTYLELFPAGAADPLGKIGIGLSLDDRLLLPGLAKRLAVATGVPVPLEKQTRTLEGREVDWFDAVGPDYGEKSNPLLDAWVMAIYPTYLRNRYPDLTSNEDGTSREKVLARQYRPDRLLRNVIGISAVLSATERERLIKLFGGAGYKIARRGASDEATSKAFRFILSTASARNPRAITYHLALNRPAKPRTLRFGASTLVIRPQATATWHFPAVSEVAK